ncbi:MAG: peptide deformylase, partial [Myxococcota bacterium]
LSLAAQPVEAFDASLARLADDLVDTLRAEGPAIGLSAPQIDDQRQVLIMDMTGTGESPEVFVNPRIVSQAGFGLAEERCLSVPEAVIYGWRAAQIRVEAFDLEGAKFERELNDMAAVCLQHEMDHFHGKILVDRMSFVGRFLYRRKARRLAASAPA